MSATASIDEVQARIQAIQSRFGIVGDSGGSGTAFQDALNNVLGMGAGDSTTFNQSLDLSDTSSGESVVSAAEKYIGVPYKWGGTDPNTGLDCSGLVQRAYADVGISMPRVAADQARQGTAVPSLAQAKPGDLVAFGSPVDHIGIYIGNNKMVVAPHKGDKVKIEDVYTTPTAIRRIIPDNASSSFTSSLRSYGATSNAISSSLSSKYNSLFEQAGSKYGLSPNLLAAVAKQESGFNASA
jgi:peptidoglycan DL-endopeptidase CwlO